MKRIDVTCCLHCPYFEVAELRLPDENDKQIGFCKKEMQCFEGRTLIKSIAIAEITNSAIIPDWCPLPDAEDEAPAPPPATPEPPQDAIAPLRQKQ